MRFLKRILLPALLRRAVGGEEEYESTMGRSPAPPPAVKSTS